MIIIRGNTLPDYHLLSQKQSGIIDDGYQHREKWQHAPILGVNINDTGFEPDQDFVPEMFQLLCNNKGNTAQLPKARKCGIIELWIDK